MITGILIAAMAGTFSAYAEENRTVERQQITKDFISLLDEDPELEELEPAA